MLKYTICFIKRGHEILMLNRESAQWMGMWNGVGGKLEMGETPLACILREVKEETGILLTDVEYKGNVTWEVHDSNSDGMYLFIAELPERYEYPTPIKMEEGILDWKSIDWLLHPENMGVANLKYFLPLMLNDQGVYDHRFVYEGDEVIGFTSGPLEEPISIR